MKKLLKSLLKAVSVSVAVDDSVLIVSVKVGAISIVEKSFDLAEILIDD